MAKKEPTTESPAPPAKAGGRQRHPIKVYLLHPVGTLAPQPELTCETESAARAALRKLGVPGKYAIVRELAVVTVTSEQVRKVTVE